jgi:hypothetical protein
MFKTRLKYLLARSFDYTVRQWREEPEGLRAEIMAGLERAAEYRAEHRQKDLMSFEIHELVFNFISPPDIPSRVAPVNEVYDQIVDWADKVV